ncbi:uncharacterized protein [Watersipora subatra]|uniref:uncharacterized protein n=1 Tax=Watersipora subatra TaxID=2589382 RepID=UPI00355AE9FB
MWRAHHKHIHLWHTARNILAIFYMWQINFVFCCETRFEDVQTKALLSQIVIIGKIHSLDPLPSRRFQDYNIYSGTVQVTSVLKKPENQTDSEIITRKQYIQIEGFLQHSSKNSSSKLSTAQLLRSTSTATPSTNHTCYSYVELSKEYILFISQSASASQGKLTYHTAQLSSNYTKTDKKLIKDVLCKGCARPPNAKSKRNVQVTEGASNYKLYCRVEGNPPPDVRWFRDGVELDNTHRGIAIKNRRRRNVQTSSIRFKSVTLSHMATYRCIAANILGEDTAKSRLTVLADRNALDPTPPPPGGVDWESVNVDDLATIEPASHYVSCTGKDKDYCLHGGECRIYPDGRYKHCRCSARYKGTRCGEYNLDIPTGGHVIQPTTEGLELGTVVIALAAVLAVFVILMLVLAFHYGGWRYQSRRNKRLERKKLDTIMSQPSKGTNSFLEGHNSKKDGFHGSHIQSMDPQTEIPNLPHRRSLNLENYFPATSCDVLLRRKSFGARSGRPASQPIDRRFTRSRLSGTSTITERRNDDEFDVLQERTPASASIELDTSRSASLCSDSHCPPRSNIINVEISSLHISETTLDSTDCNTPNIPANGTPKNPPTSQSPKNPLVIDKNANSPRYNHTGYHDST